MKKQQKIDNWVQLTKYVNYIDTMIEKKLKQEYNLSVKEFYVLYEIYKAKGKKYKINDLIKIVDLSQSAMSRLIVRIEKPTKALVVRQECLEDHRAMYIYLTEEGQDITEKALNTYESLISKVSFSNIRKLSQIDSID
ncbi:transcriptional regulator [Staphylococcus saprophyticus]|jgi:DNA-binding MarR family transcriptional regulator|uniref:Putative transcriptional regulator n=2 Tax=Bacillati TaxID=1783272 RepID=Q4A0I5_STAS1|nr:MULTISPECIES: winged helix DNA-binding protein [Staphylococcus]CRV26553.1 transcriptional regulator%2C putative [Streptococcus equi subsp. equi]SIN55274.1 MarR family transcriptional regulator [Mycobacteroides abscessus subsp. abscessus]AMG19382.1 MarR family transcriptional regulator [Staphylococcus saprophyticus]AMG32494.1 MarR family transcriptional regulator [Staphylococcus saprophyticus]ASE58438.1 MarR family transcriptional regulator [Staphylococcus saprophyticus]